MYSCLFFISSDFILLLNFDLFVLGGQFIEFSEDVVELWSCSPAYGPPVWPLSCDVTFNSFKLVAVYASGSKFRVLIGIPVIVEQNIGVKYVKICGFFFFFFCPWKIIGGKPGDSRLELGKKQGIIFSSGYCERKLRSSESRYLSPSPQSPTESLFDLDLIIPLLQASDAPRK